MTPLTFEQAKKIVLEKYPDAICVEDTISHDRQRWFAIITLKAGEYAWLSDWWATKSKAWLSAAERIEKEKV